MITINTYELILKRRTIRKFKQIKIEPSILTKLINAARHAPSASNLQPVKYIIVDDDEKVKGKCSNMSGGPAT